MKPVILTGLRANNDLTIGNYLGALLPLIDMAKKRAGEYQVNLFVPDLHSFTTPIDHAQLYGQIVQNLRVFVAAGLPLDNPDVHIYRQSYVPAHSELTWILDCFTGFGEMGRMTQFKDKAGTQAFAKELSELFDKAGTLGTKAREAVQSLDDNVDPGDYKMAYEGLRDAYRHTLDQSTTLIEVIQKLEHLKERESAASVGLFNYPVLMAADMLLYDATYVPVGDDQTQHLEYTRDVAERVNNQFGHIFTVPAPVPQQHEFFGKDQGLRIKDLLDPTKKMSKSDESGRGVIFLSDTPEVAATKIMGAATDSFNEIKYDAKQRQGVSNLLQILALFSGGELADVIAQYEGQTQYGELKKATAGAVSTFLVDFQAKLAAVDEGAIMAKLEHSEAAMREQANRVLLKAQQAVGLRQRN